MTASGQPQGSAEGAAADSAPGDAGPAEPGTPGLAAESANQPAASARPELAEPTASSEALAEQPTPARPPSLPELAPPVDSAPLCEPADALEELTFPPSVQAPQPLATGSQLGPDGRLRVVRHLGARGRVNRYEAAWQDDAGTAIAVELREAPLDHAGLRREAEVLAAVRYSMLPALYAAFEHDGRQYLALEWLAGETLEQALSAGLDLQRVIAIVLQLTQALRRLHAAGWALLGLTPADVLLEQPIRLTQLGSAVRIGQPPPQALHVAGYSALELAHADGAAITGNEDVYTLGAILYRALVGRPVPEAGAELSELPTLVPVPGGPQLLVRALAPADERLDLEAFYHELLVLKQRFARAATTIALEVASGTTVGLNPTRLTNEDSCGYVTWAVSGAEGVLCRALLCVADGMGGMEAGEVASSTALRVVLGATTTPPPPDAAPNGIAPPARADRLEPVALIRQAAPVVHGAASGRSMGTTCTVVAVHGDELSLGHVGDTRAYLLRGGELRQLTNDHSLVAAMVASGVLSPDEARGHPDSNKVLRSLGGQRELPEGYVDSLQAAYGQPTLRLQPDDWLLLCSDGVWGTVDDAGIQAILAEGPQPQEVARGLIERALQGGAPDNATAVVARCVQVPSA